VPGPQAAQIELDTETRQALEGLMRRHSTPQQQVLRARIILLAADRKNNTQIARELAITRDMVGLWRNRWASFAALPLAELSVSERLEDAPRPGAPMILTPEQICQITALACEAPEKSGRPISQWTGREIAAELMARGIVETISSRHAQRVLKRGLCNPTVSATG
jgi:putative transposase